MAGGAVAEPLHGARLGGPELLLSADARVGGARRHSNNIILYRELEEEEVRTLSRNPTSLQAFMASTLSVWLQLQTRKYM